MAYGGVPTKLDLATFAKILGIHPLHFGGIAFTPVDRNPTLCDSAILQYAWQDSDRIGRYEIAQAIADAEDLIENQLRWRLLPVWERDEWRQAPRSYQPELNAYRSRDIRGHAATVRSKWGKVLTGGVEAKTLLDDAAVIVWDGNGLGTVTVPVAATVQECEVEIYYPGHSGDPEYQIRPAEVEIAAGTATITFNRELCVSEDILESLNPRPAVWTENADFLSTVDIYRHYNDPSTQATLMWEPTGSCGCGDGGCVSCAYTVQTACLHLRSEPLLGVLGYSAGTWDAVEESFSVDPLSVDRNPDLVRLFYRAGNVAPYGCLMTMENKWARAVAYMAAAKLDRPLCSCTEEKLGYWQEDFALLSGGEGGQTTTYSFDTRQAAGESLFGSRRGEVWAWTRCVKDREVVNVDGGTW